VNLYIGSRVRTTLGGAPLTLEMRTGYPWQETATIRLVEGAPRRLRLMLRLPAWCDAPELRINGSPLPLQRERGYAVVERDWMPDDVLELRLPMKPVLMEAHPRVAADRWQVALQRGPIVYCLAGRSPCSADPSSTASRNATSPPRWSAWRFGATIPFTACGRLSCWAASLCWKAWQKC